jgi:plastocyanin
MRLILTMLLVAGLSLAFAACGGGGGSAAPSAPASAAPDESAGGAAACTVLVDVPAGDVAATIAGNAYDPATISATAGQSVTFTNQDGVPHTVTFDDGGCDSGNIAGGASATLQVEAPGTYPFHCNVHPSMTGTLEVS